MRIGEARCYHFIREYAGMAVGDGMSKRRRVSGFIYELYQPAPTLMLRYTFFFHKVESRGQFLSSNLQPKSSGDEENHVQWISIVSACGDQTGQGRSQRERNDYCWM
ncbi:hypothetical protein PoB_005011800 [Plakobranchus ocellatus]|uniref:Uncharacterized protein n=1 Tax=Plakobranchus ocellatus TaxID=259542 RepID=A0AAV4BWM1_9GAST|nr:hypothetical protein PoB_005011800 [Plakobranchus ocellatus]